MKRIFLLLALVSPCFGQAVRYNDFATTTGNAPSPGLVPILGIANATLQVCTVTTPACQNFLTTYTDSTEASTCPSNTPLTRPNVIGCFATADAQGNWGFWAAPNTPFQYTIASNYGSFGPYSANTAGLGGGAGNPSPPSLSIQTSNVGSTAFTGFPTFTFTPSSGLVNLTGQQLITANNPALITGLSAGMGIATQWTQAVQAPDFSFTQLNLDLFAGSTAPGWNFGGTAVTPNGPDWSTMAIRNIQGNTFTPGIAQPTITVFDKFADGDSGNYIYHQCDAGQTDAGGEGCVSQEVNNLQHATFATGVAGATGATGSQTINFNATGGRSQFMTHGPLIDTTVSGLVGHITGAEAVIPFTGTWSLPVDNTLTPSTAYCSLITNVFEQTNPLAPVPTTAQFNCIGGSSGALANGPGFLAGQFLEQVVFSGVSGFTGAAISIATTNPGTGCPDGSHIVNGVGGGGTGAQALIACSRGLVFFVDLLVPGTGYTSAPSFTAPSSTATFDIGFSATTQFATFTPLKPHGVASTVMNSTTGTSAWQGGFHGYISLDYEYAFNFSAQPWRQIYQVFGALDSSHLAVEFDQVSASNPIPNPLNACTSDVVITNLAVTGTTVTANINPAFGCSYNYSNLANAVISSSTNTSFNGPITAVNIDGAVNTLTWQQSGASGTSATALLSYPAAFFGYHAYQGCQTTLPAVGPILTCEPNTLTVTAGDLLEQPQDPSMNSVVLGLQQTLVSPDLSPISNTISILWNGAGIGNQLSAINIQNENVNSGLTNQFYQGLGGITLPPNVITVNSPINNFINSISPSTNGNAFIKIGCPDPLVGGCNNNVSQLLFSLQGGLGSLAYVPGAKALGGLGPVSGQFVFNNDIISLAGQVSGSSIGLSGIDVFGSVQVPLILTQDNFDSVGFWGASQQYLGDDGVMSMGGLTLGQLTVGTGTALSAGVGQGGTAGSTSYSYMVVGNTLNGHTLPSANFGTIHGNATLSSVNFNVVTAHPAPGTTSQNFYRWLGTGSNTDPTQYGLVCTNVTNEAAVDPNFGTPCHDIGATPGAAPPAVDTSGALKVTTSISSGAAVNVDFSGELTFATATTGSYTFAGTYTTHPECFVEPQFDITSGNRSWVTYTSTTSMTIHFGSAVSGNVSFSCFGRN